MFLYVYNGKYWDQLLQIGLDKVHNSLQCCNIKRYSLIIHISWMCFSLVMRLRDLLIRFESFGYTTSCIVFIGTYMESMVKYWFEDMRRNYTLAGRNGLLAMFNLKFIKSYLCMVLDHDWFFFGHFWGSW